LDVSKTILQAIYKPSKPAGVNNYSGLHRTPLKFPSLEWIRATDIDTLLTAAMIAPKLKHASFTRCVLMKEIELYSLEWPNMLYLNVSDTAIPEPIRTAVMIAPGLSSCVFHLDVEPDIRARVCEMLTNVFIDKITSLRIAPIRLEPRITFSAVVLWSGQVIASTGTRFFHFIYPRYATDAMVELIAAIIRESPHLQRVALVACEVSNSQSELLTNAAIRSKSVTSLDISSNSNSSSTNRRLSADVARLKPNLGLKLEKSKEA